MVKVSLHLSSAGIILNCRVTGHAGSRKEGKNLICAAISILIRTAVRTMENRKGISLDGEAPGPGEIQFDLLSFDSENGDWLRGVSDSLITGLLDLQEEYPEECRVNISR